MENKEKNLIKDSFTFLEEQYKKEMECGRDNGITKETVEINIGHTKQVLNFARQIYNGEKEHERVEDSERFLKNLEIAAILHDVCKLNSQKPGGIDVFEHHIAGGETAEKFLKGQIEQSDIQQIKSAIFCHSYIPFIIKKMKDKKSIKFKPPETLLGIILRDADILDLTSINGFRKIVEIRQNPTSEFYKEDKGLLKNAINSALKSIKETASYLRTETAKKIFNDNKKEMKDLVEKLKKEKIENLESFRKVLNF